MIVILLECFRSKKNFSNKIWKDLKNSENWELHIYGPISDMNYFKKMMKQIKINKLENFIFYYKPVFDLKKKNKIFKNSDGFILPSKSENFGISIGEALANGLPVLTTFETPWKIINDYDAGYVFNFSKEEIKLNLEKFMDLDNNQRFKMGINAMNIIRENFESKKIFLMYENLYTSLVK